MTKTGNVGIGTISPSVKLDILTQGTPSVTAGALKYNIANGQLIVNNQSSAAKTYWLIVGNSEVVGNPNPAVYLDRLGGSNRGENIISAVPIQ